MNEIQDIKEVFGSWNWEERVKQDPRRIYAFLLCSDEHEEYTSFIQKSWRTLDSLSAHYCDIFTLEKWEMPHARFDSPNYLRISSGEVGDAGIVHGDRYGYPGQKIAIDNGLMLPNRTQCFEVRDKLFEKPSTIVLPGLTIFASPYIQEAVYYNCSGLGSHELSDSFQHIFGSIREAYEVGEDRFDAYDQFKRLERIRGIKDRLTKALTKLSINDIFSILSNGIKLVIPK